eukprot:4932603-Pyramimonas_sp.AAC.1
MPSCQPQNSSSHGPNRASGSNVAFSVASSLGPLMSTQACRTAFSVALFQELLNAITDSNRATPTITTDNNAHRLRGRVLRHRSSHILSDASKMFTFCGIARDIRARPIWRV